MASKMVLEEALMLGELSDFVIKVRDRDFKINRTILSNSSLYFCELFHNNPQMTVCSFPDVSASIMDLILKYAYTQSVLVLENNVQLLLEAAECFKIKGIVRACCDFLLQKLSTSNCIWILTLADRYLYPDLKEKACLFILRYFEDVAQYCPDFCNLSAEQLIHLIGKTELNVRQERVVFEAVIRWINYAPAERHGHLVSLMSKVRLNLISVNYLVDTVRVNNLVKGSPKCMAMVTNTMRKLQASILVRPLARARLPAEVLLAVGGFNDNLPANVIELYNVRTNRWRTVYNKDNLLPEFSQCVYIDGYIYCVGGLLDHRFFSSVTKFNLATKTWEEAGVMHEARANLSVVTLNGFIYAMGGWNEQETLKSAERFEPGTNQWTQIAPMEHRRADAAAATLHGKVYIFGGLLGNLALSSAECYTPTTNQWTLITPMSVARGAMGAIAYNDQIFVIGGCSHGRRLANVEVFNPASMTWGMVAQMHYPCSNFGVALLEEKLYVVGGIDTQDLTLCTVWCFDADKNQWNFVRDLGRPHGAVSCCLVERVPHASAFPL
ncbi:kelch-like protein 10 [Oryzias latipes]|uniref:BTB domain-containing protein n=1 Tax=Oryzias latipes TaxID=8090 RepID=H2MDW9_ORYLA|nr:kelch-like protein 10 [Oryzias latipes]